MSQVFRIVNSWITRPSTAAFWLTVLATWLGSWPALAGAEASPHDRRPNILWIVVEDASPHISCYGETAITTPRIDSLAARGVQFNAAFVTSPVCSSSRSAMVTGMYPTTLGAHNHRSQRTRGKGGGNRAYHESYRLPVKSVPQLFREAGYYVTNSGMNKKGKTDYNFVADNMYDQGDWAGRQPGQPFFAQVQLHGGKARGAKVEDSVNPSDVKLPPYYADHPVLRRDWAAYLNTWIKTDNEVGRILQRLRDEGELQDTVIFFWTDHGISHLRGKQFLYDEGIRVPLIVHFGDGRHAGMQRDDLVAHIDIAAASLSLAGIAIPDYVHGRNIFADDYQPRQYVFAARDRCDETVDVIRCVRSRRFKYIRHLISYVPHAQPNEYKDGKEIVQVMRALHRDGKLNDLQARVFAAPRPTEELYDLAEDPFETANLAGHAAYRETLIELRGELYDWMERTRDVGLIPEPILEKLGRRYGNKLHVLQRPENANLVRRLIAVVEAGEQGEPEKLLATLSSDQPAIRYWAATWLGNLGDSSSAARLEELTSDANPTVRIAAALALTKLGEHEIGVPLLAQYIAAENLLTGMYAIGALEQVGIAAQAALPAIQAARDSPYEFTRRIARRVARKLSDGS